MTKDPVVVNPNQNIVDLIEVMKSNRLQQCPVVDQGKLLGMVTTYDLWKNANQAQPKQLVKDLMSTNIIKITPLDKVGTAAELFMDKRFKTLPVVNLRNELKGVVTAFDVIREVLTEKYPRPILYESEIGNAE